MSIYEDGTYLANNPDWHEEDAPFKSLNIIKILRKHGLPFKTCVDIGCGTGAITLRLAEEYQDKMFFGYDLSPDVIARAKKIERTNLRFFTSSILDSAEQFDLALVIDVFEHVPNYLEFIAKIGKNAKYVIFHIPLDMNILHLLINRQINGRINYGHLHYFSKETALHSLYDCGYTVKDWFYTYGSLHLSESSRSWVKVALQLPRWLAYRLTGDFGVRLLGGASLMVLAEKTGPSRFGY